MADAFRERTARLLTDYLEYCAREPGTAPRQPSSPEAAVLRCVAAQIREYNVRTLSVYRGFRWNRVELVAWMAQKLLASPRGPNWYRVASLLTFAGMLLERHPREACGRKKEGNVSRDCRLLVALLCAQLSGQHRTWLLANGGWVDSFFNAIRYTFPLDSAALQVGAHQPKNFRMKRQPLSCSTSLRKG
uniref:Bcl-2-like protein 10 n=1 Tax=Sus scrofa TaxID=9823 RepID=A0A8D1N411_PIG